MRRKPPVHRERRAQADRAAAKQLPRDEFDIFRVEHRAVMRFRPVIDRKDLAPVSRGRDDRCGPQTVCKPLRQLVCAAEVPREQRNDEPALLVRHHDRRVVRLSGEIGRDRADGDAHRPDKHDKAAVHHRLLRKARKRGIRERGVYRAGVALTEKIRQQPRGSLRRFRADLGKGYKLRVLHFVASRKPVVNAGS